MTATYRTAGYCGTQSSYFLGLRGLAPAIYAAQSGKRTRKPRKKTSSVGCIPTDKIDGLMPIFDKLATPRSLCAEAVASPKPK